MAAVAHLNIIGKASGSQNVSLEIARNTPDMKHVFIFSSQIDPAFITEIRKLGFEVVVCPYLSRNINLMSEIRSLVWLRQLHRSIEFDVVHSHSSKANILARVFKIIYPSVTVINHIHGLPFKVSPHSLVNLAYYMVEVATSWLADRIILVNHLYKAYWPYRTGKTLLNFTTTNKSIFKRSSSRGEKLRVGFVGRFDRQKNPERFIRIANSLAGGDITFHMWGEVITEESELVNSGMVDVNGWVSPTDQGEIEIDVLLVLSRWEAFCMVALEAAKRQIIPVGTPVDGFAEIVRTIGLPVEIDGDEAVKSVLIWLSKLPQSSLQDLKAACFIRSSLLDELNDLAAKDVYEKNK